MNNDDGKNNQPSDEDLIERFQNGDLYAFDIIVKRYKNQLLNYIYRFLGNAEEAEDLVQETFLRVYRNRNAYQKIASELKSMLKHFYSSYCST